MKRGRSDGPRSLAAAAAASSSSGATLNNSKGKPSGADGMAIGRVREMCPPAATVRTVAFLSTRRDLQTLGANISVAGLNDHINPSGFKSICLKKDLEKM